MTSQHAISKFWKNNKPVFWDQLLFSLARHGKKEIYFIVYIVEYNIQFNV